MEASEAQRSNRAAFARVEREMFLRIAARLPRWMTPDKVSIVGLFAGVGIAAAYGLTWYDLDWLWLASALFVLHWAADSLDGNLARVRRIGRPKYGFFVDHQCDAITTGIIFLGLGLSPLMRLPIALGITVGYFLLMILVLIVTITRGSFKYSFGSVGPTEARAAMITANTVVWATGNPVLTAGGYAGTLFDAIGLAGALLIVGIYLVSSLFERNVLARLDPTPVPATAPDGTFDPAVLVADEAEFGARKQPR